MLEALAEEHIKTQVPAGPVLLEQGVPCKELVLARTHRLGFAFNFLRKPLSCLCSFRCVRLFQGLAPQDLDLSRPLTPDELKTLKETKELESILRDADLEHVKSTSKYLECINLTLKVVGVCILVDLAGWPIAFVSSRLSYLLGKILNPIEFLVIAVLVVSATLPAKASVDLNRRKKRLTEDFWLGKSEK